MKKFLATTFSAGLTLSVGLSAGANTSEPVYAESSKPSVAKLTVLATSGNTYGNWMLPGIPDGMAAYMKDGKVQILVNHELTPTGVAATIPRAGGAATGGATISRLEVDPVTLKVTNAQEHLTDVLWYDYSTGKHGDTPGAPSWAAPGTVYHTKALNRFCSAGFAEAGVFSYKSGGKTFGYTGHVYLTGEETGDESRAFAVNTAGQAVQLPRLGLASWEVFHPAKTDSMATVLVGGEDGSDITSQLWLYVGTKTASGVWYERAGLNNGSSYVLSLAGSKNDTEFRAKYSKGTSAAVTFRKIDWKLNGKNQNDYALGYGLGFSRIEDGAFDPDNPNDYYFVTTQSNKDPGATAPNPATPTVARDGGALWKLSFKDIKRPLDGASLTMLLNGSEAPYMSKPDNIEMDSLGNILIQEDPGNNAAVARVLAYNIKTQKIGEILKFKSSYFSASGANYITEDEESSGITDVTKFFKKSATDTSRYYILNAQVHAEPAKSRPDIPNAATALASIIEGGQIYLLEITDWNAIYN